MKDTAHAAFKLGWSIIPVALDKRPLIGSWKEYQEHPPTGKQIGEWLKLDAAGWAVITGAVSKIVIIDFDGEQGRDTLAALNLDPHVKTGSGGYHVYVQHPGFKVKTLNSKSKRDLGKKYPGLDIRGDGGYAVFCGRNRAGEYEWLRPMEPDPIDVLPKELARYLGLVPTPLPNDPLANAPVEDLGDAGPALCDRLLAKYISEVGRLGRNNAGFELACQLRDNGYTQREAEGVMREFVRYTPPVNTKGLPEPYTDVEALASCRQAYSAPPRAPWTRQEVRQHMTPKKQRPEPKDFLDLVPEPSFLQSYLQYGTDITDAPPEFHLAVGLAITSAMVGNSIWFNAWGDDVFLNLWTLLLAPSGFFRKTTSMRLGLKLLKKHNPEAILPNDFTREKLQENLTIQPAGIVPVWEFGSLLAMMGKDYNIGIKEFLTEIYDGGDYRKETVKGTPVHIIRPAVSILAGSTIDWVVDRISSGDLRSGFLARYLYWPVTSKPDWKGFGEKSHSIIEESLDSFMTSLSYVNGEATFDAVVIKRYNKWLYKHENEVNDQELPRELQGFYTRIGTYVLKFAVLYQLCMTLELVVSEEAMEYAIRLAEYLKSHLIKLIEEEIAIGRDAQELKRVREIISSGNSHGMDRQTILRKSKIMAHRLNKILQTLCESDEIRVEIIKTEGRPKQVFYVN